MVKMLNINESDNAKTTSINTSSYNCANILN